MVGPVRCCGHDCQAKKTSSRKHQAIITFSSPGELRRYPRLEGDKDRPEGEAGVVGGDAGVTFTGITDEAGAVACVDVAIDFAGNVVSGLEVILPGEEELPFLAG